MKKERVVCHQSFIFQFGAVCEEEEEEEGLTSKTLADGSGVGLVL